MGFCAVFFFNPDFTAGLVRQSLFQYWKLVHSLSLLYYSFFEVLPNQSLPCHKVSLLYKKFLSPSYFPLSIVHKYPPPPKKTSYLSQLSVYAASSTSGLILDIVFLKTKNCTSGCFFLMYINLRASSSTLWTLALLIRLQEFCLSYTWIHLHSSILRYFQRELLHRNKFT